ncbi:MULTISPECIES: hypothetical protein [Halocynthiibacter]|uniref:Uncharacterized protein n=1 Tax=Halocynthiibacter halioticoli TaxID=2986804 RepID=A0AAE3J145_9RHOB|nr:MULTISPECIES: hypothetical protein [Halocynthiibacter]MCV6826042.1 hypothetical protein [Halocynthiibacter halioticoli]MCW4059043.1 hypothetical protein [Halocynthiibacter sp. SDUM655004]
MSEFGHKAIKGVINGRPFFSDGWGEGPFAIRVKGKRYTFEDSDLFGPALLNKGGSISERQPISERHPFWLGYVMWRKGGRKTRWKGRVCVYEKASEGTYWKDDKGTPHFLTDPPEGLEYLGYRRVNRPAAGDTQ